MRQKFLLLIVSALFGLCGQVMAQSMITGNVKDISGEPIIPNRSLEKVSCHFLMTAIRKTVLYMLDL